MLSLHVTAPCLPVTLRRHRAVTGHLVFSSHPQLGHCSQQQMEAVPPPITAMNSTSRKMENLGGREYKYFTEISQMMFVFGEVQDPLPETVNLVEDIVRSQIIELVCPACFVSSMVWWMCVY